MNKLNSKNIWLIAKTLAIVAIIIVIKMIFHKYNLEFISINNLFSGIIAANVFLMGFLLSGVLSDFKESEKIPGELVSSLSAIHDEFSNTYNYKDKELGKRGMDIIFCLCGDIENWFFKKVKTHTILQKINILNGIYSELDKVIQPNYVVRLKNETSIIKKIIIRIDTIRDTNFISSGYIIASITTVLMCTGLIISKIEPFYESLFFVSVISFLMIFLLLLIHDLDNPFGYYSKLSTENVSLYPLRRFINEIRP
jgi:hypothetical protein